MNCQDCGRPATTVVTDVVQNTKRVRHLCDGCARRHGLAADGPAPDLDLQALVHLVLGHPAPAGPPGLTCPGCGLQYAAFRADGRLGCPADYDAFRPALEPLLARVHRATAHAGKRPRAGAPAALRARLRAAVAAEDYEQAARLRDRLRDEDPAE